MERDAVGQSVGSTVHAAFRHPTAALIGPAYETVMLMAAVRPRTYQPSAFLPIDRTR